MGKKTYVVESDFDDLHGDPDNAPDLELDLSDSDNPIIQAALSGEDDNWTPPEEDGQDEEEDEAKDEDGVEDDDQDDDDEDSEEDSDDDEDEEDEESEEDDEEEDEDGKYSRKVQKRIEREREARRRDNDASSRRIATLERKGELRDARDTFREEEQSAKTKLSVLRKKKIAALDDGETEQVVDIDEEILDIKADLKAKQIALKQQEADVDNDDSANDSTSTPAEGQKFLTKYPQFHSSKSFRDVVLLTDKSVAARGFDRNTPDYYEEMENILRPQFPKIIKKATKVTVKRKKKRSAVGSTTKAGTRRSTTRSRRGVVRLTKEDQKQMEVFGMDPHNPVEAKAWAESKGK